MNIYPNGFPGQFPSYCIEKQMVNETLPKFWVSWASSHRWITLVTALAILIYTVA